MQEVCQPGVAIVEFTEDMASMVEEDLRHGSVPTRSQAFTEIIEELDITEIRRVFPDAGEFEERTRREGLHRLYRVTYSPGHSLTRAATDLSSVPGVVRVEGEPRKKLLVTFDDPRQSSQRNFFSDKNNINLKLAWDEFTTGNPDVIVSVVDSGIDVDHEDLASNCMTEDYGCVDFSTGTAVMRKGYYGDHGTHVAGIIAAVNNNGKGVTGIAGGDYAAGKGGVRLMSCKIFGAANGGSSAEAIKWGADHGAVICQNSWGYDYDVDGDGSLNPREKAAMLAGRVTYSDSLAIDYFVKYAGMGPNGNQTGPMAGGVVLFATGNEGLECGAPANCPLVISVAAAAQDGGRESYSNYGDWVSICAPGNNIISTLPENKYGGKSGTSMACPHVSGVAALLVSYFGGQGFTADMLKSKLLSGGSYDIVSKRDKVGPLLDAYSSFLGGSQTAPDPIEEYEVSVKSNIASFKWTVPADQDDRKAYGAYLVASTDESLLSAFNPKAPAEGLLFAGISSQETPLGQTAEGQLRSLDFETDYFVAMYAYDFSGNISPISAIRKIRTGVNHPPVISSNYEGNYRFKASEVTNIRYTVTDEDGHSVKLSWSAGSQAISISETSTPGTWLARVNAAAVKTPGDYTLTLTATDEAGAVTVMDIVYTILENHAPAVTRQMEDRIMNIGQKLNFKMEEFFTDEDEDQLYYSAATDNALILKSSLAGYSNLTLEAGRKGVSTVTFTAKDGSNKSTSFDFRILVKDPDDPCDVFPNPVASVMTIRTEELAETTVTLTSSTGVQVFTRTSSFSGFEPLEVDMSPYPPGRYVLKVSYSGKEYVKTVIKI